MATIYGNTTNHWRAYLTYSTEETSTTVKISVTGAGFQSVGWGFQLSSGVSTSVTCTGQSTMSGSGGFYSDYGATAATSYVTATYTISKGTSAKTVTLGVTTTNSSGYMDGTSSTSVSISIPALASYAVTYSANGGSGAPAAQTKYYGQTLTLSSTKPTRNGYSFLGWNASSSATSASYQPGATYTTNAALALYAVWKLDYIPPTITSFKAIRCNSSGTAQADGTYVKLTCVWKVDTTINSSNKATKVVFNYRNVTNNGTMSTSWQTVTVSAASGTTEKITSGWNTANIYEFNATVYDSGGSTTASAQVAKAFATIDIANSGNSVGIGCIASESTAGLDVAMAARFTGGLKSYGRDVPPLSYAMVGNNSEYASGSTAYWRRFASITITAANTDRDITFLVSPGYGAVSSQTGGYGEKYGLLTAHLRAGTGITSVNAADLYWHYAQPGIDPSHFVMVYKLTSGTSLYAELWARNSTSWQTLMFNAIDMGGRNGRWIYDSSGWTLYTDITGGAGSTSYPTDGYTAVTSKISSGGVFGSSNGWTYIKYANGFTDMYYRKNHASFQMTQAFGSSYYGTLQISFPYTLMGSPLNVVGTVEAASAPQVFKLNSLSTTKMDICISGATGSAVQDIIINARVWGKWR